MENYRFGAVTRNLKDSIEKMNDKGQGGRDSEAWMLLLETQKAIALASIADSLIGIQYLMEEGR